MSRVHFLRLRAAVIYVAAMSCLVCPADPVFGVQVAADSAGACPRFGDCCDAHGGVGCEDFDCCNEVCSLDQDCCSIGWDQECADFALTFCDSTACRSTCPGTGDCCSPHEGTGCFDEFCCDLVCTEESFCCTGEWTDECSALARVLCGDLCEGPQICPTGESCCLSSESAGCDDGACCRLACLEDPSCCNWKWDTICADEASWLCAPLCAVPCPGEGDCCEAHGNGGCSDAACCASVCEIRPSCCDTEWDQTCVELAEASCAELCQSVCPGPGDCCTVHESSGCNDAECCNVVCQAEPFCCFLGWGLDCISAADDLCGGICSVPSTCPGTGDCCTEHETAGCEDKACCERVCVADFNCCGGTWHAGCAALAAELCGHTCGCPNQFADFDGNAQVDLWDFSNFQLCFSGADPASPPGPDCICGDATNNRDVDAIDARAFANVLTGP